jgi:hypothetical protein
MKNYPRGPRRRRSTRRWVTTDLKRLLNKLCNLRVPSNLVAIVSKNVFCGANRPFLFGMMEFSHTKLTRVEIHGNNTESMKWPRKKLYFLSRFSCRKPAVLVSIIYRVFQIIRRTEIDYKRRINTVFVGLYIQDMLFLHNGPSSFCTDVLVVCVMVCIHMVLRRLLILLVLFLQRHLATMGGTEVMWIQQQNIQGGSYKMQQVSHTHGVIDGQFSKHRPSST